MANIAIIGGGFCGVETAKRLRGHKVILFDNKDYFEFTPSVHKLITNPNYDKKIRIPYGKFLKAKIVKDKIKSITSSSVITESGSHGFDYLVICSGSETPKPPLDKVYSIRDGEDAKKIGAAIEKAREILVVGGGYTGSSVAGELITKTTKKVRIVNAMPRLVDRMCKEAGDRAADYLYVKGAEMALNKLASQSDLENAEIVIWCGGTKPNTSFLNFPKDDKGMIVVDTNLKVKGTLNVFAGGDIINFKEEKNIQNAAKHGALIAENIKRSIAKRPLKAYRPQKLMTIVSLGDNYSILGYGDRVMDGRIPAAIKHAHEKWTMLRLRYL